MISLPQRLRWQREVDDAGDDPGVDASEARVDAFETRSQLEESSGAEIRSRVLGNDVGVIGCAPRGHAVAYSATPASWSNPIPTPMGASAQSWV